MRPVTRRLVLLPLAFLITVTPAAPEPSGFPGLPWGAPLPAVEAAMKAACGFAMSYTALTGEGAVQCSGYPLDELGPVDVRFEFVDGQLRGYTVSVRRAREAQLRAAAPRLFQLPAGAAGTGAHPSARFDHCMSGFSCLTVRTPL